MNLQLITFLVMVAIFMLGCFLFKLPVSVSLMLSSIGGALAASEGGPHPPLCRGHVLLHRYHPYHLQRYDLYESH